MNPEIDKDGTKRWFNQYGQLSLENGPACEWTNGSNGSKFWYLNGEPHRLDGPAFEYADGTKRWYINGFRFTEKLWLNKVLFNEVRINLYETV
jgi:hypothetical protein